MRRRAGTAISLVALLGLVGCPGESDRSPNGGASTATPSRTQKCDVTWQFRELGKTDWSNAGPARADCRKPPLRELKPDTSYQFRRQGDDTDSDIFTTQPDCDDVQGADESLAAFVESNPAGTQAQRRVLCLRPGTQDIRQLDGIQAWTTLTPRGTADGTKETAVLHGNLGLDNRGVTIEDVKVVGCYAQAGCETDRNKTVDVRASDVSLLHVELTQRGGRDHDRVQCVLINGGSQLTNVALKYSKVHSCGSESSGNLDHGLYCSKALRPVIAGNWFYDSEGYGIQLYPDCDGALVAGNVVAENGGACDVDISTGVAYVNGFCGFGRENARGPGVFPPIHCGETSDNRAIDMVLYDPRSMRPDTDCWGDRLSAEGTLIEDPQFVDRAAYDFRMRNPLARAKLGIYAEIRPGPRW